MSTSSGPSALQTRRAGTLLLERVRRPEGSGGFVAEIDGLRFFAILPVVLDHAWWTYSANVGDPGIALSSPAGRLFSAGELGVQLFFVISGYVLGLGFYSAAKDSRGVGLGGYFVRRLRRLEPPFLLVMTVFFLLLLGSGRFGFGEGLGHYLASITYLHGLIYHAPSAINTVTWSLEVELQFYLLAPALYAAYRVRLLAGLFLIGLVGMAFVASALVMGEFYLTLLSDGHFFLLGAVFQIFGRLDIDGRWWFLFPATLGGYFLIEADYASVPGNLTKLGLLAVVFATGLGCAPIRRFLSTPILYVIGGACYSIYLIHYPLLSALSKAWAAIGFTGGFAAYLGVALLVVLAVSMIFYLFAERPFMTRFTARKADNQRI